MASIVFFPKTRSLSNSTVTRWRRHCAELAIYLGFYLLYLLVRGLSPGGEAQALANADRVIALEQSLGLFHEAALQSWFMANAQSLVTFLNWVYVITYWPVILAVALVLYVCRPATYCRYRNLMAVHLLLALTLFLWFPLAPPFKTGLMADTIQQFGPSFYGSEAMAVLYNTNAAMPSLHFSWTCILAWLCLKELRGWYRYLGVGYPLLTLAAILVTGNHYLLDALAGAALIGVALGAIKIIEGLLNSEAGIPKLGLGSLPGNPWFRA